MTESNSNRTIALIVLITMGAFFIRLPGLEKRPMHGDEANQAYKTGILLEDGTYVYDPHDHHGPSLYYVTLIPAFITGHSTFDSTTETTYRIVPVIFGSALILLSLLLRPALPPAAIIASALLVTVSPAFVFYSRYYIQETLLVFFTLASIGIGYRFLKSPSILSAILLGASLSLMHATKETAVIAYVAMIAGLAAVYVSYRSSDTVTSIKSTVTRKHLIAIALTAVVINIVLYTAFFTHARGPLDSILTYGNYLKRATGAGLHDKPWYYYLQLLVYTNKGPQYWFSEAFPLILATPLIIATLAKFRSRSAEQPTPMLLFLTVYTLTLTLIYSIIPYKTPWTMLSFYHGFILLSGCAFAQGFGKLKTLPVRATFIIVCFAGLSHLAYQSYLTNHVIPADPRNPYVYAHTSSAHMRLVQRVHDLQAVHPDPESFRIHVIQPDNDYWPLPWYLRNVQQVGYFSAIPESPDADMIIASPSTRAQLSEVLQDDYTKETGGLRPSVLRDVYINRDLWDTFMDDRK